MNKCECPDCNHPMRTNCDRCGFTMHAMSLTDGLCDPCIQIERDEKYGGGDV